MRVTYRPATPDDYGFIVTRLSAYTRDPVPEPYWPKFATRTTVASALVHGATTRVVAEAGGALVGFYLAHGDHPLAVYVAKEFRKQGVARRLQKKETKNGQVAANSPGH